MKTLYSLQVEQSNLYLLSIEAEPQFKDGDEASTISKRFQSINEAGGAFGLKDKPPLVTMKQQLMSVQG